MCEVAPNEDRRLGQCFVDLPPAANALLFALGVALVARGVDRSAVGAVWIAERPCLPKVLVGATLVSVLTTVPELTVSVAAAALERLATAIGNAIGSAVGTAA